MPNIVMRTAQTLGREEEYDKETEAICTLSEATIDSGEQFRFWNLKGVADLGHFVGNWRVTIERIKD